MLVCMHVCVYVWRLTLLMSKQKHNSLLVMRKYLLFTGKLNFTEATNFTEAVASFASYVATALLVNLVSVTTPGKKLCTPLGIWGLNSSFFMIGGLVPLAPM